MDTSSSIGAPLPPPHPGDPEHTPVDAAGDPAAGPDPVGDDVPPSETGTESAEAAVADADARDDTPSDAPTVSPAPARARLLGGPTVGGAVLALLFWWQSLGPSLMPRSWVFQALVGAVCLGVGHVIGSVIEWVVRSILGGLKRDRGASPPAVVWRVLAVATLVLAVAGVIVWPRWQREHNELMGMDGPSSVSALPMLLLTVVVLVVLVVVGRLVWRAIRWFDRWLGRRLPRSGAIVVATVVVVFVGGWLAGKAFDRFETWARDQFGAFDTDTDEGIVEPTDPTVSGSPESLLDWDDLGRQGRTFVASATTEDELRDFHGAGADIERPVRIYAGLKSADSAEARADLAVADLERAGGFERDVLVVTTVTGTGWVDPDAATAVEQLHAGSSAMIAMQYSYLPSWISSLVDGEVATEAGAVLFDAVHRRWSELPEDDRPRLIVFGQSLGSFGGEAAFAGPDAATSIGNMVARTEGVLFTGPTNDNEIWQQLASGRDAGSPVWRPVVDEGRSVRFTNRVEELLEPMDDWVGTRILYVQHPSDPVTFWNWPTMWSRPEWTEAPTGYDIPDRVSWFPFVTWAQGVADLSAGFGAQPGFGHDYRNAFVPAFAAVAPPDGWTTEDSQRLMEFLGMA
jgi:uncharacterized membrane protein